jgi:transcriptional regulator with PAS, ATPase and Fis domain
MKQGNAKLKIPIFAEKSKIANQMTYLKEASFAVTICDKSGKILEMNDKSVKTFVKDGQSIIGRSLMDCHPESAQNKLLQMFDTHEVNAYTIEKNGVKKLIYQAPWCKNGEFAGYIELSLEIPEVMRHFVRG